jgi:S1-C subfamily serine protease
VLVQPVAQSISSSSTLTTLPSVADIVEMIRPSVVNITTQYDAGSFLFRRSDGTSNGSGYH